MSHESTHSLDGARGPRAHPPRPDGGQLDTAGPGPAAAPWTTGAQLDRAPSEHAGRSTGKTAGPSPGSHRQITGVYREVTGSGPCTGSRRGCARLFTVNKAPSGPQLPAPLLARGAPAGPPGHSTGDSPAVYRENPGPDFDPQPAARPSYMLGSRSVSRVPSRSATPPPAELRRRLRDGHRRFTGGSPGPHRLQPARPPERLARPHLRGSSGVSRGPSDPRHPPTGKAPARRGALHRRFTGGSSGVHREKPGPYINPPPPRHGPRSTALDKL